MNEEEATDVKLPRTWKAWIENVQAGIVLLVLLTVPPVSGYLASTRKDPLMFAIFLISLLVWFFLFMRLAEKWHGMREGDE